MNMDYPVHMLGEKCLSTGKIMEKDVMEWFPEIFISLKKKRLDILHRKKNDINWGTQVEKHGVIYFLNNPSLLEHSICVKSEVRHWGVADKPAPWGHSEGRVWASEHVSGTKIWDTEGIHAKEPNIESKEFWKWELSFWR